MKSALIIVPHLSTGGSCQFTLNKIKMLLSLNIEVFVIEYDFISPDFVVQRNQIKKILSEKQFAVNDRFISFDAKEGFVNNMSSDKNEVYRNYITLVNPDFIFLEENPKMFMDAGLAEFIYSFGKPVYETTHDSSFPLNIDNRSFKTFVSPYSALQYIEAGGDLSKYVIIEDPININLPLYDTYRDKLRETLGFDENKKHVVIVGLFTQRKNQGYAFEIAKHLKGLPVEFHFIGNMAGNFQDYWQPLIDNKPDNCIIHGEKDNVSDYLYAADLFLFPSYGNKYNKELNPLVIREALANEKLPLLLFDLDVYLKRYTHDRIHYLTGDSKQDAIKLQTILSIENPATMPAITDVNKKNLILIGAYPNNPNRVQLTLDCIESVKALDYDIAIASHFPVPKEIQEKVDAVIYDRYNPITTHSYYNRFYSKSDEHYAEITLSEKPLNQSLCVLNNIKNGLAFAYANGYDAVMYINYDIVVHAHDFKAIEEHLQLIKEKADLSVCVRDTDAGKGIETTCMFLPPYLIEKLRDIPTDKEGYNEFAKKIGAQNYLEHFLYKYFFEHIKDSIYIHTTEIQENTILVNSGLGVQSCSEYVSILPVEGNPMLFCLYSFSYNTDDRKKVFSMIKKNGEEVVVMQHDLKEKKECYQIIPIYEFGNGEYVNFIEWLELYPDGSNSLTHRIYINENTREILPSNGIFRFLKQSTQQPEPTQEETPENKSSDVWDEALNQIEQQRKPRIRLVHLMLKGDTGASLNQFHSKNVLCNVAHYNWDYIAVYNEPYTSRPPSHNCRRPEDIHIPSMVFEGTGTPLTPAHYGCYEAFKNAVLSYLTPDIDLLIVCEGDCKLLVKIEDFVAFVESSLKVMSDNKIAIISYGDKNALETGVLQSEKIESVSEDIFITNKLIGLQCIGFLPRLRHLFVNLFTQAKWDAMDILINEYFSMHRERGMGAFPHLAIVENRLTSQYDGYSIIEQREKKFL